MAKLTYLCLALVCGLLAVSAQRPAVVTTPVVADNTTAPVDASVPVVADNGTAVGNTTVPVVAVPVEAQPVENITEAALASDAATDTFAPAAVGDGPSANPANANISKINTNLTAPGPTTVTTADNTTSAFTLAQLQALEQAGTSGAYPTSSYTLFLADIHFVAGNLSSQYIAYHFCHFVSADFLQCALYNGKDANSRFIGNEYFITQAIFNTLPDWERNLWHSHPFEVQSGLFVAPDLSVEDDLELQQWLMGTFGKVTDTWQYYDDFPIGPPQVGLALALASQVNWTLAAELDVVLNMSTTYQERQQQRAGLVAPPRTPGADNYLFSGYATNYQIYSVPIENNSTTLGAANATGPVISNATAPVTTNITLVEPSNPVDPTTLSPQAAAGAFDSLPNPSAPTTIGANV